MIAVSWTEFAELSDKLLSALKGEKFDCIIAVSRGGLVAGRILSDKLGLPLGVVSAKAYLAGKTVSSGMVIVDRKISIAGDVGRNALLVDDIADKGGTLEAVGRFLEEEYGLSVKSAVIFKKKACRKHVDYFASSGETDWIVMPYETREFSRLKEGDVK